MRLNAVDLACRRGGREVFTSVSFRLARGEAMAVTGRNGAGKSSLLRLIGGFIRPSGGRVWLDGSHAELTIAEQAHYLGHQDAVKPSLSIFENLQFWADFFGDRAIKVHEALEAVGPIKAMLLELDAGKAGAVVNELIARKNGAGSLRDALTAFAEAEGVPL